MSQDLPEQHRRCEMPKRGRQAGRTPPAKRQRPNGPVRVMPAPKKPGPSKGDKVLTESGDQSLLIFLSLGGSLPAGFRDQSVIFITRVVTFIRHAVHKQNPSFRASKDASDSVRTLSPFKGPGFLGAGTTLTDPFALCLLADGVRPACRPLLGISHCVRCSVKSCDMGGHRIA